MTTTADKDSFGFNWPDSYNRAGELPTPQLFFEWFNGAKTYRLSAGAFFMVKVATEALSQRGVTSDSDPRVRDYILSRVSRDDIRALSYTDRESLSQMRYGFLFDL